MRYGIPNFGIGIPIFWLSRHQNSTNIFQPESLESKTESEFRLQWGSQKSELKIGIPNLAAIHTLTRYQSSTFPLGWRTLTYPQVPPPHSPNGNRSSKPLICNRQPQPCTPRQVVKRDGIWISFRNWRADLRNGHLPPRHLLCSCTMHSI